VIPGYPRGSDVHEFLARLAVIEPEAKAQTTDAAAPVQRSLDVLDISILGESDEYNIVLTARPKGSLLTALWNSSYFIFIQEQSANRLRPAK
jgi:hypothetical protein